MDWIHIPKDDAHVKREREKARALRHSPWWKQQCQPGTCHYCKQHVGPAALTMDHVIPVARGGTSTKSNVVPACKNCNAKKTCATPAEQILDTLFPPTPKEESPPPKRLHIATPHGFCTGVARAIQMAETLCSQGKSDIYCLNEIVHNQHIVAQLTARGMRFVRRLDDIPPGAHVLFPAHGVTPATRQQAEDRHLHITDATCPFVDKVHAEVRRYAATPAAIICIGHRNHEEVIGIAGEAPGRVRIIENAHEAATLELPPAHPIAIVTQTTLSPAQVDTVTAALSKRYATITRPPHTDICYATRDRQDAVRALARQCAHIIVLGSANSSNSQRLVETARDAGTPATLITEPEELHLHDWAPIHTLGITSGASTPEALLDETVATLTTRYGFTRE